MIMTFESALTAKSCKNSAKPCSKEANGAQGKKPRLPQKAILNSKKGIGV